MKYQPIIDDEIEIKDFVQKFIKQPNKHDLESFLLEKIDPKHKYVVKLFDNNNCVKERKINDLEKIDSDFYGSFYKKVKLQIRLEDKNDIDNLKRLADDVKRHLALEIKALVNELAVAC